MIGYKLTLHLHLHYSYSYAHDNNISASQIQQFAASVRKIGFNNQLVNNRLVVNKVWQAMGTHPKIGLFVCSQLARFLAVFQTVLIID